MSHRNSYWSALLTITFFSLPSTRAAEPLVLDTRLELTLVAEHPQIVTPVGCTYDHLGRLLVVESHTHFPPDDYSGPQHDRIRILTDTDQDGRADKFETFQDGLTHTMSLASADEWVYVATRKEVFRLRDIDGDGRAEKRENLIELKTEGNYPHNGLGGLAFDKNGQLLFGLGENLGASYSIVGSDGTELAGGGEGGNIYTCGLDGSGLRMIATGFWNPFGICTDPTGRIFTVGNDPDARPPCRLVHVVETGDYGYQFRFGRSGKHPLQAWDGELPGTLPMVAGTGEAPSGIVPYFGKLWVTSWGDYRIERFNLISKGASFTATREIVVQGDNHFRPVDFAVAPDGSLVFTDWVQKSYPVHGQGRVWRLSWKGDPPAMNFPATTPGERAAAAATARLDLRNMDSDDPFLQAATIARIAKTRDYEKDNTRRIETSSQRLGFIAAARWNKVDEPLRSEWITAALSDHDPDLQLYGVRWVAEDKLTKFRPLLEDLAKTNRTSLPLFQATVAAMDWLDKGETGNATRADYLARIFAAPAEYSPEFLVESLRSLPSDRLSMEILTPLVQHSDPSVQRAAVRSLALSELDGREPLLTTLVASQTTNAELRKDAAIGLTPVSSTSAPASEFKPTATDTAAWERLLAQGQGDANRGWRVFFGKSSSRCADCHTYQGRGANIGPDLTEVTKRLDRRRLIESILQPSREVAPRYVVTQLTKTNGQVYAGMSLGAFQDGVTGAFLSPTGERFSVAIADIESRQMSDRSVMPDGLEATISVDQFRDLLALLETTTE